MLAKPQVIIVVPEEMTNDEKGDFLERIASELLKKQRYEVTRRIRFAGMEIDILAKSLDTG